MKVGEPGWDSDEELGKFLVRCVEQAQGRRMTCPVCNGRTFILDERGREQACHGCDSYGTVLFTAERQMRRRAP